MQDLAVKFQQRVSFEGHPFTEILYTWRDGDKPRNACSRVWYVITDSPHARAAQAEAFKKRRTEFEKWMNSPA
jgi:hypothetical protein